jgi:hypothetical protein
MPVNLNNIFPKSAGSLSRIQLHLYHYLPRSNMETTSEAKEG